MSFIIPSRYSEIVTAIFKAKGYLFGGSVRDFIRSEVPNDLDVAIVNHEDFYTNLDTLGFVQIKSDTFHKDDIIVQVCELYDEDDTPVNVSPDFDVNTLAWDGQSLFNFWNREFDITPILNHITLKQAEKINPTPERITKMINKGWSILEAQIY